MLALYGIRENIDLDVVVSPKTFLTLRYERGLEFTIGKRSGVYKYRDGEIEIFGHIPYSRSTPCILTESILDRAVNFKGYNFMTLLDLLRFKQVRRLEHDISDIKLIEKYLDETRR